MEHSLDGRPVARQLDFEPAAKPSPARACLDPFTSVVLLCGTYSVLFAKLFADEKGPFAGCFNVGARFASIGACEAALDEAFGDDEQSSMWPLVDNAMTVIKSLCESGVSLCDIWVGRRPTCDGGDDRFYYSDKVHGRYVWSAGNHRAATDGRLKTLTSKLIEEELDYKVRLPIAQYETPVDGSLPTTVHVTVGSEFEKRAAAASELNDVMCRGTFRRATFVPIQPGQEAWWTLETIAKTNTIALPAFGSTLVEDDPSDPDSQCAIDLPGTFGCVFGGRSTTHFVVAPIRRFPEYAANQTCDTPWLLDTFYRALPAPRRGAYSATSDAIAAMCRVLSNSGDVPLKPLREESASAVGREHYTLSHAPAIDIGEEGL